MHDVGEADALGTEGVPAGAGLVQKLPELCFRVVLCCAAGRGEAVQCFPSILSGVSGPGLGQGRVDTMSGLVSGLMLSGIMIMDIGVIINTDTVQLGALPSSVHVLSYNPHTCQRDAVVSLSPKTKHSQLA